MNRFLKVSALLVGALGLSLALALATAAPAAAGGKHGKRGWDRDHRGGGYSRDYGRGYGRDYRRGPRHGRYWGKPGHRYRKAHRGYRPRHYGHRHRHNDLGAAIALGALISVPFILSSRQYEERTVIARPAPTYPPPPPQAYPQSLPQTADSGGVCLQEREYQTTVTVGGEQVPAYGTACLQPDGAWRRGPATAVPR